MKRAFRLEFRIGRFHLGFSTKEFMRQDKLSRPKKNIVKLGLERGMIMKHGLILLTVLGLHLQPLPMAETLWNFTTTVQSLCKQQTQPQPLAEIPRNKLRLKESFGRGCLGEVSRICIIQYFLFSHARVLEYEDYFPRRSRQGIEIEGM